MSQILEKLHKVDPNDSDAVKESVAGFFQNVIKHTEINCYVWLRELEHVITRFPRHCAQHRRSAEQYLAHFLDSPNLYHVIEAAKCAHALQQIRPSPDKAATAKNCWREQMSALCDSAHRLMDVIFASAVDAHARCRPVQEVLGGCALTTALRSSRRQRGAALGGTVAPGYRLRNILIFIQAMLVEPYPVGKPVRPRAVLAVVLRALGGCSTAGGAAQHEPAELLQHALGTLDALVACLGSNLIPLSALVVRCVMQALRWTSERSAPSHGDRLARCAAYASLTRWLGVAGGGAAAGGGAWRAELAAHLARDVTPTATTLQLTMNNQYSKKLSKKARRKLTNSLLQQSALASHAPGERSVAPGERSVAPGERSVAPASAEQSEEVAVAALECAELLLAESGAHLAILQERLVRAAYELERLSERRAMCVLRALQAGRAAGLPAHHLLQVYSSQLHSPSHQIRKFCSQGLLELKLQLHSSLPSLNFASEPPPDRYISANKSMRMSRKNRAALESLLGKERCDSSLTAPSSDGVITIADEPSSKRPRLESQAITDNISVSSDSVESLRSTDDDDVIVDSDREIKRLTRDGADTQANVVTNNVEGDDSLREQAEENDVDEADIRQIAAECEQSQVELIPQTNIYEASTQIPLNTSTDQEAIDGDKSPVSMEIVYDTNTENKVTLLDRTEDDTLPSTNDSDDVQITCGQVIRNSQELNVETIKITDYIPKVNGVTEVVDVGDDDEVIDNIEVRINSKEITVDDMLADFVDEPIEEGKVEA